MDSDELAALCDALNQQADELRPQEFVSSSFLRQEPGRNHKGRSVHESRSDPINSGNLQGASASGLEKFPSVRALRSKVEENDNRLFRSEYSASSHLGGYSGAGANLRGKYSLNPQGRQPSVYTYSTYREQPSTHPYPGRSKKAEHVSDEFLDAIQAEGLFEDDAHNPNASAAHASHHIQKPSRFGSHITQSAPSPNVIPIPRGVISSEAIGPKQSNPFPPPETHHLPGIESRGVHTVSHNVGSPLASQMQVNHSGCLYSAPQSIGDPTRAVPDGEVGAAVLSTSSTQHDIHNSSVDWIKNASGAADGSDTTRALAGAPPLAVSENASVSFDFGPPRSPPTLQRQHAGGEPADAARRAQQPTHEAPEGFGAEHVDGSVLYWEADGIMRRKAPVEPRPRGLVPEDRSLSPARASTGNAPLALPPPEQGGAGEQAGVPRTARAQSPMASTSSRDKRDRSKSVGARRRPAVASVGCATCQRLHLERDELAQKAASQALRTAGLQRSLREVQADKWKVVQSMSAALKQRDAHIRRLRLALGYQATGRCRRTSSARLASLGHPGTGDADSLTGVTPEEERFSSSLDARDPLRAVEAEDMVAERMLRSARGRRGGDAEGGTTHVPSSLAEAQMAAAQLAARNSALQAQLRDRRRMYLRLQEANSNLVSKMRSVAAENTQKSRGAQEAQQAAETAGRAAESARREARAASARAGKMETEAQELHHQAKHATERLGKSRKESLDQKRLVRKQASELVALKEQLKEAQTRSTQCEKDRTEARQELMRTKASLETVSAQRLELLNQFQNTAVLDVPERAHQRRPATSPSMMPSPCSPVPTTPAEWDQATAALDFDNQQRPAKGKHKLGEGPTRVRAQLFCGTEDKGDGSESELSDTMNSVMDDMELALRDLNTLDQGTSSLLHSSPRKLTPHLETPLPAHPASGHLPVPMPMRLEDDVDAVQFASPTKHLPRCSSTTGTLLLEEDNPLNSKRVESENQKPVSKATGTAKNNNVGRAQRETRSKSKHFAPKAQTTNDQVSSSAPTKSKTVTVKGVNSGAARYPSSRKVSKTHVENGRPAAAAGQTQQLSLQSKYRELKKAYEDLVHLVKPAVRALAQNDL